METGAAPEVNGVVRWRRGDLQRVIKDWFGVANHEPYVGTLLKKLNFLHMSDRPRHAAVAGICRPADKRQIANLIGIVSPTKVGGRLAKAIMPLFRNGG